MIDIKTSKKHINNALSEGRKVLTETESKDLLESIGIPVTKYIIAKTEKDVIEAASKIGYPVVLKIASPEIIHKSDIGGIALNISLEVELLEEFHRIMKQAKSITSEENIWGVAVQEMVKPTQEIIIGSKRDSVFGQVLLIGLGGVWVELLNDVALRLIPASRVDILEMLSELRGKKIIDGFRGYPPMDIEKIIEIALKISSLLEIAPEIKEMDLNPIFVYKPGEGAKVVDARILLSDSTEEK